MNINEFINKTKNEPLKWISYCEIIIDPYGNIIIANPSHTEMVIAYAMGKKILQENNLSKKFQ